jgi:alpha-ribazole phosphatase
VTLWLMRHAQPLVGAGVCYGATDMPADAAATAACAAQAATVLPRAAQLWCSPRQRCTQLAEALRLVRPDLQLAQVAGLAEMDFGCWEGVRWDAIPKAAIDAWTAQFWDARFGGRDSVRELMERVAAVWARAQAAPGPVVWITHAGVIRAASLLSAGTTVIARADQWPVDAPGFGGWVRLALHPGARATGVSPAAMR